MTLARITLLPRTLPKTILYRGKEHKMKKNKKKNKTKANGWILINPFFSFQTISLFFHLLHHFPVFLRARNSYGLFPAAILHIKFMFLTQTAIQIKVFCFKNPALKKTVAPRGFKMDSQISTENS